MLRIDGYGKFKILRATESDTRHTTNTYIVTDNTWKNRLCDEGVIQSEIKTFQEAEMLAKKLYIEEQKKKGVIFFK